MESCLQERTWVCGEYQQTTSQQFILIVEMSNSFLEEQQVWRSDLSSLFSTGEPVSIPVPGSCGLCSTKDVDTMEKVQQRVSKMIKEIEYLMYREWLRAGTVQSVEGLRILPVFVITGRGRRSRQTFLSTKETTLSL